MIEILNVTKRYGENEVLNNVTLKIEDGKKYYICGENGIGKSVFLKMLVGYSRPTSGKIIVDQEELGKKNDFILDAGVSINSPEFVNQYTGMENLLEISKIRKIADKECIIKLAHILEIENDLNKKVAKYSLGMKQKLRLIQAIMEKPKYIILDEPFDALDQNMKQVAKKILDDAVRNGSTLIFTSHDSDADDFADITLHIKNKNVIEF